MANCYAERLIASIRRECLDHVIVLGERHLRDVLRSYARYHNGVRTHLSLAKDSPLPRAVQADCITITCGFDFRHGQDVLGCSGRGGPAEGQERTNSASA